MMTRGLLFLSTLTLAACSSDKAATGVGTDGGVADGATPTPTATTDATPPPSTDAGTHHIDRSHLKSTGTTGTLDYSDAATWACLPGNDPNECHDDIDATEFLKDNTTQIDKHTILKDPPFDCFYVYPTVALGGGGNMTDFSDISLVLDPLLAQAARFTQLCEVYAPLYRQVSLSFGGGAAADAGAAAGDAGAADAGAAGFPISGDATLAYGDVEAAFNYYMAHYNKGRKFVLMGHSQGTAMLTQLIINKFDKDADLRKQLISALLIGGSIQVPVGKDVGGTFQNIPLCTKPAQTGCVVAYNSFAKDAPPGTNSLFGKPTGAGLMNACTNPSLLAGNSGRYKGSYSPVKFFDAAFKPDLPDTVVPTVSTPITMVRDMFTGACKNENGFSYLEIDTDQTSDDKRPIPPYRTSGAEGIGFGMHIEDYSIEQDDLLDTVSQQAKAVLGGP
ncbi:MAG TPA: DUF3089 domain-containing protein [Polyangiaceae bacterium]|jgi:hypothetical protein|nr:DUF3089 domain-containing protein [Polyangiaceae bacterium]